MNIDPRIWCRWRRARTEEDAEKIRVIRNGGRLFMTRNTDVIEAEEQKNWFWKRDPAKSALLLFETDDTREPIGYGLAALTSYELSHIPEWALTGCVAEKWRGKGLGRKIFETLIEFVPTSGCWLEVREDNGHARSLYESLGFREIKRIRRDGVDVVVMVLSMVTT